MSLGLRLIRALSFSPPLYAVPAVTVFVDNCGTPSMTINGLCPESPPRIEIFIEPPGLALFCVIFIPDERPRNMEPTEADAAVGNSSAFTEATAPEILLFLVVP